MARAHPDLLPPEAEAALASWRSRALIVVLTVVAVSGLPAYLAPIWNAVRTGRFSPQLWVYCGIYLAFVVLAFLPRLADRPRAWAFFALAYTNAAASLARLGLAGSGRLYLLLLPAAAVLLVGIRAGYLAAGLSLVMYAGFTVLARLGVLGRWLARADNPQDLGFWLEAGAALAVFLVTLTGLVQRFHRLHARTLAASFRAGADRARLTGELRERQERLDLVMQATNDGIWDWDLATNQLYLSPRWKQMLGYAEEEIADHFDSWHGLLHPEDLEPAMAAVRNFLDGRTRGFELEHRLRHKDGSYRWILARGIALRDAQGRAYRMVASHTDVTERRRTAEALSLAYATLERRVEERTRALELLNSLAALVSGRVDLREILQAALEQTMRAFDIETGGAYGLEEESGTLTLLAHRGLSAEFVQRMARLPLEVGLAGRQLNLQQPLSWSVEEYPEGELRRWIVAEGLQLILAVPLVARGKLMGSLVLNCLRPRALAPEESSLLIAAGQQIGLAMENARLLEMERSGRQEANRRREVAEGLRETLQLLNAGRPLQETLDFIIQQACRLMGSDAASLLRMHSPEGQYRIQAACGLDADYAAAIRFSPGKGGPGRALAARRPLVLPDALAFLQGQEREPDPEYEDEKAGLDLMLGRGFRELLAVPLVVQGEDYGGITLYYRTPHYFAEEELELAMSVVDQAALAIENDRLRGKAGEAAAFAERNRLARELHDSVTQSLYSVSLYAEAGSRLLAAGQAPGAAEHLRELGATARGALREMRLLIFELAPPALDKASLVEALQTRLDAVESRGGMTVSFRVEGTEALTPPARQELFQIAQEALNNALKHSRAQKVRVLLQFREDTTRLEIGDDGVGFLPERARKSGGMGLRGMQERAQRIGADLQLASDPGGGTTVSVELPARPAHI